MPSPPSTPPTFSFQSLKPTDPYYPHWVSLRRRARVEDAAAYAGLALLAYAMMSGRMAANLFGPPPEVLLFLLWGIVMLAVRCYRLRWPCPRCGRPFYWGGLIEFSPVVGKCRHCGLPES